MGLVLQRLFFLFVVRPLVLVVLGLNVRHRERLPRSGPAIVVANHNSHLDTLVLMTLFRTNLLPTLRPVAALDYFGRSRAVAWFTREVLGGILIPREGPGLRHDPLAQPSAALARDEILIVYPEGSRGEPERLSVFRSGVAHLARAHPDAPVVPVFLHGLGKVLPRGEWLPVPFFCDVFVGEPVSWRGDRAEFMARLTARMEGLADEGRFEPWE